MQSYQETLNRFNKECKKGNHEYIDIYSVEIDDFEEHVVNWCSICGATVAVVMSDGRLMRKGKLYGPKMVYRGSK